MMDFTQEQLKAAKAAKSPEELLKMAKGANVALTPEQAEHFLQPNGGELSDEELENVTGGCGGGTPLSQQWKNAADSFFGLPNFHVGTLCTSCQAQDESGQSSVYCGTWEDTPDYVYCHGAKCFACGNIGEYTINRNPYGAS